MPGKKVSGIKIPDPLLVYPYSPVAKPFEVPPITEICEGHHFHATLPCALVPYILGALEVWRWEDSFKGTVQEKQLATGLFRDLMGVIAMAARNCDCDPDVVTITRINPDTGQIEISTDNGATWSTDPGSPYVKAVQQAPLKGDNGTVKQCEAANNVIDNMKDLQSQYSKMIGEFTSVQDLIVELIVVAAGMLFLPLIGQALLDALTPLIGKVLDLARMLIGADKAAYDALFTEANWTTMRCILYCNGHSSGQYNQGDWSEIIAQTRDQLGSNWNQAGANMAAMIDFWGLVGLNNAASVGQGTEGNCDDCACGNCSNLNDWSLTYGSITFQEPGHWTIQSGDAGSGNQAVRIVNYSDPNRLRCCTISWDGHGSGIQNQAYYLCGDNNAVNQAIPQGTCGYDFAWTNIFGIPFVVDVFFTECP